MAAKSEVTTQTNGCVVNAVAEQVKDTQNLLPHLESLERIIKLPVVGAAWDKSQDVYGKVKGTNRVFNWALNAAEDCVSRAVTTAAPIVNRLDGPIQYVDQTLVRGIDKLEVSAPIIKDTPTEIYNQAKTRVMDAVQPHIERVAKFTSAGTQRAFSLKDLAWQKANEVLATQYGCLAVSGVDSTTALAERLLEYYFPKSDSDMEEDNVDQHDIDNEIDAKFLVAASTVFLSMSFHIVGALIEYIRSRPEIYHYIDRELQNFIECQSQQLRTPSYIRYRPLGGFRTKSPAASIEMSRDK